MGLTVGTFYDKLTPQSLHKLKNKPYCGTSGIQHSLHWYSGHSPHNTPQRAKRENQDGQKETAKICTIWEHFCRDYQTNQCRLQAPHSARLNCKYVTVQHICAKCFLATKAKADHPESSQECPQQPAWPTVKVWSEDIVTVAQTNIVNPPSSFTIQLRGLGVDSQIVSTDFVGPPSAHETQSGGLGVDTSTFSPNTSSEKYRSRGPKFPRLSHSITLHTQPGGFGIGDWDLTIVDTS